MAEEAVKKFKCHFCGGEFDQKYVHDIQYVDDGEFSTDDETDFIICNGCLNTAYERKGYGGCEVCERWTGDMASVMVRAGHGWNGGQHYPEPDEYQDMCQKCAQKRSDDAEDDGNGGDGPED